nr:transposase (putative), gypsy type [Tanacetum cinerariifolium]
MVGNIIDIVTSMLTQSVLNFHCSLFNILTELRPELPDRNAIIKDSLARKIGMYTGLVEFANFHVPLSNFFLCVLEYYQINLAQLSIIGATNVSIHLDAGQGFVLLSHGLMYIVLFVANMGLLDFVKSTDPFKVKINKRTLADNEEGTESRFVTHPSEEFVSSSITPTLEPDVLEDSGSTLDVNGRSLNQTDARERFQKKFTQSSVVIQHRDAEIVELSKVSTLELVREELSNQVSKLGVGYESLKGKIAADVRRDMDTYLYPHMLTAIARQRWVLSYNIRLAMRKYTQSSKCHSALGKSLAQVEAYDPGEENKYMAAVSDFENVSFSLLEDLEALKDASLTLIVTFYIFREFHDETRPLQSSVLTSFLDLRFKELEQAPLSPDYVPSLEEPEQASPSPIYLPYVPELVYPEYMPPEYDVFPAKEQSLPVAATPTADSPGYILKFNPKKDLEEDDEEDPVDYPANSTVVALPAVDHVPSEEKRLRFASPTPSQEVRESSAVGAARQDEPAVAMDDLYSFVKEELYGFLDRIDVAPRRPMSKELDYGITDTWDELVGANEEIVPTTLQGVNQRVTDLSTIVE